MRTRVQVQERTLTTTTSGERTEAWSVISYHWAAIRPLSTKELLAFDQVQAIADHEVRMWYDDEITHEHRLKDDNSARIFNIASVFVVDERNHELRLLCKEAVS